MGEHLRLEILKGESVFDGETDDRGGLDRSDVVDDVDTEERVLELAVDLRECVLGFISAVCTFDEQVSILIELKRLEWRLRNSINWQQKVITRRLFLCCFFGFG